MFETKFSYTTTIINQIASLERFYGQLTAQKLIPSFSLRLTEENRILATHYSTSIEGNPLTPHEVTNVVLDERIPTNKSEREVKNYFDLLIHISVMAQKRIAITTDFMLMLHRRLMDGIVIKQPGEIRGSGVIVGHRNMAAGLVTKHNPPAHTKEGIEKLLNEIFDWLHKPSDMHPLIRAGILHHQLAYIHPFFDGNGRIARLLTSYYLLLEHYEVTKYFILDDYYDIDRLEYSDKLHSADTGDKTAWLEYFLEGISYSLKSALGRIEKLSGDVMEKVKGDKRALVTKREEDVLQVVIAKKQIKTSDIQSALGVTRQQGQFLLSSLVDKGILQKFGKTKNSYYELQKKSSATG